jgi:sugar-specific transcriptional regulator TrmB
MDTQILLDIGLTPAEIKIYLALLELGSATAGPIIERSGLQSSVVYLTLHKLMEKGLISSIQQGRRHYYQAANPRHIVEYLTEKKERLEAVLPELLARQLTAQEKPEIVTFRDRKGVKELLRELLEAGGTEHHTFGSTVKSLMLGDAWWVAYHTQRAQKGISAKLLFNESLKSWKAEAKYPRSEVRYTKAGFEPLTETIIRNDKIGVIIWTEKPLGILIHQKEAAASYELFFQNLWERSGK